MKWSTFNWPFNCLMIERRRIKISIWSDHESNKVDVLLFQFLFAPFGSSKWTFRLIECIRNLVKKIHVQWAELSIINTEGFCKSTKLPIYSTKWKIRLYSTTEIGVKVVLRCNSWKWNIVDILPFPGKIYSQMGQNVKILAFCIVQFPLKVNHMLWKRFEIKTEGGVSKNKNITFLPQNGTIGVKKIILLAFSHKAKKHI